MKRRAAWKCRGWLNAGRDMRTFGRWPCELMRWWTRDAVAAALEWFMNYRDD